MDYDELYKGDREAQAIGEKIVRTMLELYDHFYPRKADDDYVVLTNKSGKKHLHDKDWTEDKAATFYADFKDFVEMVVPNEKQIARWVEDILIKERHSGKASSD